MGSTQTFSQPDVVIRAQATVGEGPVWDRRTGRLCWVDIDNGLLFENDLETGDQIRSSTGVLLGAAVPRARLEGFAVAVADGFGILANGKLEILDPVLPEPERRMNDAKCDSRGRLWAGSTHLEFTPGVGTLHRWDGNDPSNVMAQGFSLPNGLGWNSEDTIMYLVDSMRNEILHAPYRSNEGEIGDFGLLCSITSGLPDGLAVDVEGCLWVAIWGGAEVHRYSPTGELIGRVPMPVQQPSSCAFSDDGTLYITSASAGLTESQLLEQPLAGSVFALSTNTHGVPVQPFAL